MQLDRFNSIMEAQADRIGDILICKGDEHATDDRLHNFRAAAALTGRPMRDALAGMMLKHTVSIYDMCTSENRYSMEQWDEKITDHIAYLYILKAVVCEENDETYPKSEGLEKG